MQRILVIGDSWAVPPSPEIEIKNRYTYHGHLVIKLQQLGWQIENRGVRGGSNLDSWSQARYFSQKDPAWIVWFHTDLCRDWFRGGKPTRWNYKTKLEQVARMVYSEIKQHLEYFSPSNGLILIEGQSERCLPWFNEYIQPRLLIEDWRSEICDRKIQSNQIFSCIISNENFLNLCNDSYEDKSLWLAQAETVLDQMALHKDLFPDHCHPGDFASAGMALRLHELMTKFRK